MLSYNTTKGELSRNLNMDEINVVVRKANGRVTACRRQEGVKPGPQSSNKEVLYVVTTPNGIPVKEVVETVKKCRIPKGVFEFTWEDVLEFLENTPEPNREKVRRGIYVDKELVTSLEDTAKRLRVSYTEAYEEAFYLFIERYGAEDGSV